MLPFAIVVLVGHRGVKSGTFTSRDGPGELTKCDDLVLYITERSHMPSTHLGLTMKFNGNSQKLAAPSTALRKVVQRAAQHAVSNALHLLR